MKYLALFITFLFITGCSSFDRSVTKFEPLYDKDGHSYYKYTAFSALQYPLESPSAEKTRIQWLESWLKDNNLNTSHYEIVSRKAIKAQGLVHDIYYIIKVKDTSEDGI